MSDWHIYGLSDPRDNRIRYVGFTTRSPAVRLADHLRHACGHRDYPLHRWIQKLKSHGVTPVSLVIESGSGEWDEREKFYIAKYRATYSDLLNLADGGHFNVPPESRKKAGDKMRGRTFTPEQRRRMSEGKMAAGTKRPDIAERNRRSGEWLRGKALNISEAERGRRRHAAKVLQSRGHWLTLASPEKRAAFSRLQSEKAAAAWAGGRRSRSD